MVKSPPATETGRAWQQKASLDPLFYCLSDATRRAILARLSNGSATVAELAAPFPISMPAISKHISIMEKAGLVLKVRSGRSKTCLLNAERLLDVESWLNEYRHFWAGNLDSLAQFLDQEEKGE